MGITILLTESILQLIRIATFVSAIVIGVSLLFSSNKERPSALLGLFVLLYGLGISFFIAYMFFDVKFELKHLFFPLNGLFLGAPVLYLYLKKLLGQLNFLRRKDWVHLVPGVIELGTNTFIFTSPYVNESGIQPFLFSFYNFYYFFSTLFILLYCFLIFKKVSSNQTIVKEMYATSYKRNLNWLRLVAVVFAIKTIVAFTLFFVTGGLQSGSFSSTLPIAFINLIFVLYVGISGLLQPKVLPEKEEIKAFNKKMEEKKDGLKEKSPEVISQEAIQKSKEKFFELETLMENEKLYLNPEISAFELARKLHVSQRNLSKVIADNGYKNFNNYINHYRVETAKEMLKSDAFQSQTILSIGYDSGFNSKATFYSTFKKFTGETPLQYRDVAISGLV